MAKVFAHFGEDATFRSLVDLGLHHEQQHQELILTDIKHLLSLNPMKPAYREQESVDSPAPAGMEWLAFDGGLVEIGHDGDGFCFDNESPRHKQYLNAYSLASRLVTNGEYLEFIADGGYRDPRLWLSEGWDWVQANRDRASDLLGTGRQALERIHPRRPAAARSRRARRAYLLLRSGCVRALGRGAPSE